MIAKDSVYTLTRYYPELIENIYPWYVKIGANKFKMTRFGSDILNTYWYVKYKSKQARLCSLYYCKSSCCYPKIKESIFENRFMHVSELKRMGADIEIKGKIASIKGPTKLNGAEVMATQDLGFAKGINVHGGAVRHQAVADALGVQCVSLSD